MANFFIESIYLDIIQELNSNQAANLEHSDSVNGYYDISFSINREDGIRIPEENEYLYTEDCIRMINKFKLLPQKKS